MVGAGVGAGVVGSGDGAVGPVGGVHKGTFLAPSAGGFLSPAFASAGLASGFFSAGLTSGFFSAGLGGSGAFGGGVGGAAGCPLGGAYSPIYPAN